MGEQMESETQEQRSQGAGPLLVSAVAGAAAGALAVIARKALSSGGGAPRESGSGKGASSDGATRFDDVDKVADDLAALVDELRSVGIRGDTHRQVEIADTISEYADQAADAFNATLGGSDEAEGEGSERRVTDDLMSRVGEIIGGEREQAGPGSSREKSRT